MQKKHREYRITFQPRNRSVFVLPGTTVLESCCRAGIYLKNPCGGQGSCGQCRVLLRQGNCPPSQACRDYFSESQSKKGWRLACEAQVQGDCVFEIPEESLYENNARILVSAEKYDLNFQPSLSKQYLEMTPDAGGNSHLSDVSRLEKAADGRLEIPLRLLRQIPKLLKDNNFKGTLITSYNRFVAFEEGDTTDSAYGVAFDLGTSSIVGCLLNLDNGRETAVEAVMNPQIKQGGDDVLARIQNIRTNPEKLKEMQSSVIQALNEIIEKLAVGGGITINSIYEISVAGNTAMQHIFAGITPAALGEIPFSPVFQRAIHCRATSCGITAHPEARLYIFPNIGGFVGGDTVAGIIASAIQAETDNCALIDIGTNGEIVLAVNGRLLAASSAAGPAFEGSRIRHGMRAADGAIEKIVIADNDLDYNIIGNKTPLGICGTALIDLIAELLRVKVIDEGGRILPPAELPPEVPQPIRERLRVNSDGSVDFQITYSAKKKEEKDIFLFQKDVRELQLAAGAIRAGLKILLKKAGIGIESLHRILIAGGFGNFIRPENALRIGLLPPVENRKLKYIGNASSMGTKLALLSREIRKLSEKTAMETEHFNLSDSPEFQEEFASAMLFPED